MVTGNTTRNETKHEFVTRMIATAILETIQDAGPNGIPAGHIYAAVMSCVSLDAFEQIMSALVKAGKAKKRGHVYYRV